MSGFPSERFYIIFRSKIGRVTESRGAAEKIAFDDYDGKTKVVGEAGLRALGLDPNRQGDWTTSRSAPSARRESAADAELRVKLDTVLGKK